MRKFSNRYQTLFGTLGVLVLAQAAFPQSEYGRPEPVIAPSPDSGRELRMAAGERVVDLDVSPLGPEAALLVEAAGGMQKILLWDLRRDSAAPVWSVPSPLAVKSLAWHPAKRALFLSGSRNKSTSVLLSLGDAPGGWTSREIFSTPRPLRRLAVGPRPFFTGPGREDREYRLFFGIQDSAGGFSIHTITENGKKPYQVIGKREGMTPDSEDGSPSSLRAASALPLAFHPAGHLMLWEDSAACFETAGYNFSVWGEATHPVFRKRLCGGTVTVTPNGLALLHWQPGKDGVDVLMLGGASRGRQAAGRRFAFTPSSVPDGKGVVGWIKEGAGGRVAYVPLKVPLADVVNAWMFVESEDDLERLGAHGGLLRNTRDPQIFNLYESENYYCGEITGAIPTRPYLVTTDAFWEVFAAAYQGLFLLAEKEHAIPAFWKLVGKAREHFAASGADAHWNKVFSALDAFAGGKPDPWGEAQRIENAAGSGFSAVLGRKVAYGELKPRGHYASNPEFARYFKAFAYLTRLASDTAAPLQELERAPAQVRQLAGEWIRPYTAFIAGSRSPLAWSPAGFAKPSHVKRPLRTSKVFPLGWAMDNEILNSVVFHPDWPAEARIEGPQGPRLLPSGLEIPAVFGNPLASRLAQAETARYPRLGPVLTELRKRAWRPRAEGANLYDSWLDALTVQWAATPGTAGAPGRAADWKIWEAKRLQTGLASWATLRHATVLVNETGAAECGEGGYEEIVLRPPRGYVEPDPATFKAIADLFRTAAKQLRMRTGLPGKAKAGGGSAQPALSEGLAKKLEETGRAADLFAAAAAKELRGMALSDSEYAAVQTVGRIIEHHFLIYNSLSREGLGLPTPDPIPKIADIFRSPEGAPYLFAAVGHPLEWNQVVPFYGRRAIVKGPVYSYYGFTADSLYNDKEWQASLSGRNRPDWIRGYVSDQALSCPPRNPF